MKRKHAGQTLIPLPGAIGFAHDPDEVFAAKYGREKMEAERAAYLAERACTCGSPKPNFPFRFAGRFKKTADGRVLCATCGCVAVTTTAGRWICGGWCPN